MKMTLRAILEKNSDKQIDPIELANQLNVPNKTIDNALRNDFKQRSLEFLINICKYTDVDINILIHCAETNDISPAEEETRFIERTSLKELTIMGVKFKNENDYWDARDSTLSNIYEGYHPIKEDIIMLKASFDQSTPKFLDELRAKFKEN